ncbi:hypothetical protein BDV95DRAFT_73711 [Massariosphaeria phaeospora]|uniref:ABM domain-containing protein n=1 Tax=Massariosphaeria phaeospora TaxID=100035 RepID=A0A7C8MCT9_9PLEO|nr:hypothetical protein BDV95DRAFT_73711 [Massariosphaeria phaeospora]
MANSFCEWIEITADAQIHVFGEEPGRQWLDILYTLQSRFKFEGHQKCYWAQVEEQPELLWIWIGWQTKAFYEQQKDSEQSKSLYTKLADFSSTPLRLSHVEFEHPWSYAFTALDQCWPSITLLYYPPLTKISAQQRNKLREIKSMALIADALRDPATCRAATMSQPISLWTIGYRQSEKQRSELGIRNKSGVVTQASPRLF